MKLTKLKIQNFRSFQDEEVRIDNLTCLVGANGSGKSTILMALNVFFRNNDANTDLLSLTKDDFHHSDTTKPVKITLVFEALSPDAQEDLKEYYRQGKLIISAIAEWDEGLQRAQVRQVGSRLVMKEFRSYFAMDKEKGKADKLKAEYKKFRDAYKELPDVATKDDMKQALQTYEEAHPELCGEFESNDDFYGFTRGSGHLSKYLQWVYVPAVKDAATEQDESKKTALGQLLERTVRTKVDFKDRIKELEKDAAEKYEQIIDKEKESLAALSQTLTERLQEWSTPRASVDLKWNREKSISVAPPTARAAIGEDEFVGDVTRLGHGLQRSFLVALLQELAGGHDDDSPTLILGFEEPELYQHPSQIRYMLSTLEKVAAKNAQIIVTTHSPYLVPGNGFESVRMTRKEKGSFKTTVKHLTLEKMEKELSTALGEKPASLSSRVATIEQIMQPSLKELFFTPKAILVEGVEDVAFISSYLELLGLLPEFRRYECHFIVVGGKTNMSRPLAIANGFGISTFSIFDGDTDSKPEDLDKHKRNNKCLLNLSLETNADPLSKTIIWSDAVTMWPTNIRKEIVADYGEDIWNLSANQVREENGWNDGVSKKNGLLITATIEKLWVDGKKSSLLEALCKKIIDFAKR